MSERCPELRRRHKSEAHKLSPLPTTMAKATSTGTTKKQGGKTNPKLISHSKKKAELKSATAVRRAQASSGSTSTPSRRTTVEDEDNDEPEYIGSTLETDGDSIMEQVSTGSTKAAVEPSDAKGEEDEESKLSEWKMTAFSLEHLTNRRFYQSSSPRSGLLRFTLFSSLPPLSSTSKATIAIYSTVLPRHASTSRVGFEGSWIKATRN
jgi:hypothetical protein